MNTPEKPAPQHFAVLVDGRTVEDPLTLYQLKDSAERRFAALTNAGHKCELVTVPRALVEARLAAALSSIKGK